MLTILHYNVLDVIEAHCAGICISMAVLGYFPVAVLVAAGWILLHMLNKILTMRACNRMLTIANTRTSVPGIPYPE